MKQQLFGTWLAALLVLPIAGVTALAQPKQPAPPQPAEPPPPAERPIPAQPPAPAPESPGGPDMSKLPPKPAGTVEEILRLQQAHVAPEVIKVYVENAPFVPPLSAADVIALKEHGVPDDITTALLKRSGELRNAAGPAAVAPLVVRNDRRPAAGRPMDPEGYDFWWYHYAYPRALASANERLLSSYAPYGGFYPYSSGFYPPLPYRPGGPWRP